MCSMLKLLGLSQERFQLLLVVFGSQSLSKSFFSFRDFCFAVLHGFLFKRNHLGSSEIHGREFYKGCTVLAIVRRRRLQVIVASFGIHCR